MPLKQSNVVNDLSIVTEINRKESKWNVIRIANQRISPGQTKLIDLINDLQKSTNREEYVDENSQISERNSLKWTKTIRQRLANIVQQNRFQYLIISLVLFDLIIILIDLILAQLSLPCLTHEEMKEYNTTKQRHFCILEHSIHLKRMELSLFYISILLIGIFILEVLVSFYVLADKYWKNPFCLFDSAVVFASFIMEIYFHYEKLGKAGRAASAIIVLRLWKIIRAVHAVAHSLTLKNRLLIKKIEEAKTVLEDEREQIEQNFEKQNIILNYYVNLLTNLGKLPSKQHVDKYVNEIWMKNEKLKSSQL